MGLEILDRPEPGSPVRSPFQVLACGSRQEQILRLNPYVAAQKYVRGEFDVGGDFVEAVRYFLTRGAHGLSSRALALLARLGPLRFLSESWTACRVARGVRYHYDRSNEFYRQFLDDRMVYSCAYFARAEMTLEEAQAAKLDLICRKLRLKAGERFLDIGCGWGALVLHAVKNYSVRGSGCTISPAQAEEARARLSKDDAARGGEILLEDYRNLRGPFDKIASVGMFEHVGPRNLGRYFAAVKGLLRDGGLFLNHGIFRPEPFEDGPETLFLQKRIFPQGRLAHLSNVIRQAELAGFETLDVENLRPHYARTCREWVRRLQANATACLRLVDRETYRSWLVWLAGSAIQFEEGFLDVQQVLFACRGRSRSIALTRDYLSAG